MSFGVIGPRCLSGIPSILPLLEINVSVVYGKWALGLATVL